MATPPNSALTMMDGVLRTQLPLMLSLITVMVVHSPQSTDQHGNTSPSQAVVVTTTLDGCGQSKTTTSKSTGTNGSVLTMMNMPRNAQPSPGTELLLMLGAVLPLGMTTPTLVAIHLMTVEPSEVQFPTQ